jgi:hypothetical protein
MLRAMMGIRALPTLSYLLDLQSGHCVAQSRGCAGADRSSISSFHLADLGGKLLKGSIFGPQNLHSHRRSGEAIPSEPSSLAYPIQKDWRARVAEREGVHSLGESERADVMRH